jgi:hypothetical protein
MRSSGACTRCGCGHAVRFHSVHAMYGTCCCVSNFTQAPCSSSHPRCNNKTIKRDAFNPFRQASAPRVWMHSHHNHCGLVTTAAILIFWTGTSSTCKSITGCVANWWRTALHGRSAGGPPPSSLLAAVKRTGCRSTCLRHQWPSAGAAVH